MNCLHISLTLLSCCLCVSVINGQFQKMFGQQTVLDGNTGPSDGKILIKSELDIKTTFLPVECSKVTKKGDTIFIEYDVCSFLFSVNVAPGTTSVYDAWINDEHKETSKETENMPAGQLEFKIGKKMVIPGLDLGVLGMCIGEKRTIKIPPQLAWGSKGIPGVVPENAEARFEIELVKIEDQGWTDWYVEMVQIVAAICFACGAIALTCEKIRERKGGKKKSS